MFKRFFAVGIALLIGATVGAWEEDVITDLGQLSKTECLLNLHLMT